MLILQLNKAPLVPPRVVKDLSVPVMKPIPVANNTSKANTNGNTTAGNKVSYWSQ